VWAADLGLNHYDFNTATSYHGAYHNFEKYFGRCWEMHFGMQFDKYFDHNPGGGSIGTSAIPLCFCLKSLICLLRILSKRDPN